MVGVFHAGGDGEMGFEFIPYNPPQLIHSIAGGSPRVTSKHPSVFPAQVLEAFLEHITNSVHAWHKFHTGVIQEVVLQFCCLSNRVKHGGASKPITLKVTKGMSFHN